MDCHRYPAIYIRRANVLLTWGELGRSRVVCSGDQDKLAPIQALHSKRGRKAGASPAWLP
eukprot:scaffold27128_cov30-Prasinocladus_malaysianus.AAC.1